MVLLNGVLCLLGWVMHHPLFREWWTMFSLSFWIEVFLFIWTMFWFIQTQYKNTSNYFATYLNYYNKINFILNKVSVHSFSSLWNFWVYRSLVMACLWKLANSMLSRSGLCHKVWMKSSSSLASAITIENLYFDTVTLQTHLLY